MILPTLKQWIGGLFAEKVSFPEAEPQFVNSEDRKMISNHFSEHNLGISYGNDDDDYVIKNRVKAYYKNVILVFSKTNNQLRVEILVHGSEKDVYNPRGVPLWSYHRDINTENDVVNLKTYIELKH